MRRLAPLLSATLDQRALDLARKARETLTAVEAGVAVATWEQHFSQWLGRGHVRAFGSGRGALLAVARALDLGAGDGVIVPAFTCQSVINALRYAGAEPRFADIETDSFGLDVDATRAAITPSTRAILLQHTFGLVGRDVDALRSLAHEQGLLIIEDCAHALGASWRGERVGRLGDAAIFSFERGKMLTSVHGGMAVVHDPAAAERLDQLAARASLPSLPQVSAQLASVEHDYWTEVGDDPDQAAWARTHLGPQVVPRMWPEEYSGDYCLHYEERMTDPVAAIAASQFERLDGVLARRRAQADAWEAWAASAGFPTARVTAGSQPAWLRFPLWVDAKLKANPAPLEELLGVEVGVWFTSPSHPVPTVQAGCPRGMAACDQVINLPTLLPAGHPFAPVG
jgi:dTDP-4-amino-4,6-dideoxygalactose transaminase